MKCPACGAKHSSIWKISFGKTYQCNSCQEKFVLGVSLKKALLLVVPLFLLNFLVLQPLAERFGFANFPVELICYLILAISIISTKPIANGSEAKV